MNEQQVHVNGPETEKFLAWYRSEKAQNGLLDIKFFTTDTDKATVEKVFGEVNRALTGEVITRRKKL